MSNPNLCLSCSTLIPKATSTYLTPCCSSPICSPCLISHPRLREYIPCLRCGDGVKSLDAARKRRVARVVNTHGANGQRDRPRDAHTQEMDERFSLGDDSDEEGGADPFSDTEDGTSSSSLARPETAAPSSGVSASTTSDSIIKSTPSSPPPDYTIFSASSTDASQTLPLPSGTTDNDTGKEEEKDERMKHFVKRGDTVRSIATRYAMDPYDLLQYNSLPHTCLSTNPHLLQTRRSIYLSPTSLRTSSSLPDPNNTSASLSNQQLVSQWQPSEEDRQRERKRQEEKKLKRFQLVTKELDRSVGRVYLALAGEGAREGSMSGGEGKRIGGGGKGEVLFSADGEDVFGREETSELPSYDLEAGKTTTTGTATYPNEKKPRDMTVRGTKEDQAVNQYLDDDAWEFAQESRANLNGNGKLKGKMGEGRFRTGERLMGAPFLAGPGPGGSSQERAKSGWKGW